MATIEERNRVREIRGMSEREIAQYDAGKQQEKDLLATGDYYDNGRGEIRPKNAPGGYNTFIKRQQVLAESPDFEGRKQYVGPMGSVARARDEAGATWDEANKQQDIEAQNPAIDLFGAFDNLETNRLEREKEQTLLPSSQVHADEDVNALSEKFNSMKNKLQGQYDMAMGVAYDALGNRLNKPVQLKSLWNNQVNKLNAQNKSLLKNSDQKKVAPQRNVVIGNIDVDFGDEPVSTEEAQQSRVAMATSMQEDMNQFYA